MDLSEVFDAIIENLLIEKFYAYVHLFKICSYRISLQRIRLLFL